MKLTYFNNSSFGGLADYAHYQANALANLGVDVDFICPPDFDSKNVFHYKKLPLLSKKPKSRVGTKAGRAIRLIRDTCYDIQQLNRHIYQTKAQYVLFGAYFEYFSPLWARSLQKHARNGTTFATVLHDPVRDTVIGPIWWHKRSVRQAYEFIHIVLAHQKLDPEKFSIPSRCSLQVIPHGPYQVPGGHMKMDEARKKLNIDLTAPTLLAFGNIRDNKNLDLAIRCLPDHSRLNLLIAGHSGSTSQKQPDFYRELAEKLGVSDRISWHIRYIPDDEVGIFFSACDGVLLTYSAEFRSASGVLNLASSFKKRCIASSGLSPLEDTVKKYLLGEWVEPDCLQQLSSAIGKFFNFHPEPKWENYFVENTWENNAALTINSLKSFVPPKRS